MARGIYEVCEYGKGATEGRSMRIQKTIDRWGNMCREKAKEWNIIRKGDPWNFLERTVHVLKRATKESAHAQMGTSPMGNM